jgi:4-cresol dehydrogenase (hydroxylating)
MTGRPANAEVAIEAWRAILGPEGVLTDSGSLNGYERSTLAGAERPAGVIRVSDQRQVVEVVRLAGEHGLELYPISRGKNWGYGDASPVREGQFVLDLSGMDRILEVDSRLAYAVVEPGVTQRQLHAYLEDNGYPLAMSCTGSSPDASVLGNLLERGYGVSRYGDHAAHACGMEVVLGDGTVVKTGLGRYPGANDYSYRWGLGPHLDGLFSQSNLGIVTRVGIWLMPRPKKIIAFSLSLEHDEDLEPAVERIRGLRLEGIVNGSVYVENGFRSLAALRQYPWKETGGATPLSWEVAQQLLRSEAGVDGRWTASGAIYAASGRHLRALVAEARSALRDLGELRFISPSQVLWAGRMARPLAALGSKRAGQILAFADYGRPLMGMLAGEPSNGGLRIARWRLREQLRGECDDPTLEGCGLYWLAPVCPARGEEVRRCVDLIGERLPEFGFEPLIRVAFASERSVFVTTLIAFDRGQEAESRQAAECHRELSAELMEAGFPPYRQGVGGMDLLDPDGDSYWRVVRSIKEALDPNAVLAPGRYDPEVAKR